MQTFQLHTPGGWYGRLGFSPDGRWLALSGNPFVLLDTTGQERPREFPTGGYQFAFIRNGTAIAFPSNFRSLGTLDLATGAVQQQPVKDGYAWGVASGPDAESVYLNVSASQFSGPTTIRVIGAADLKSRGEFGSVPELFRELSSSADGRWVAARSHQYVWAWHVEGKQFPAQPAIRVTPKVSTFDFALSADVGLLAAVSTRGLEVWNTADGAQVFFSGKHRRAVWSVAFCPARPLIATGDGSGNVFLWDTDGRVLARYDWGLKDGRAVCFAPDGLRCAAADTTRKVVVWDVDV